MGASNNDDGYWQMSNRGSISIDLAAPGVTIYSTDQHGNYRDVPDDPLTATSFATPYVTGVVALVWSKYPSATWQDVRDQIFNTVRPVSGFDTKTKYGGVVDAWAALADCNRNDVADAEDCYMTPEYSGDCSPSSCGTAECIDGVCYTLKSRYLSIEVPQVCHDPELAALRVRLTNVAGFPSFNGETRWVGPPAQHPDGSSDTFWAAPLQCDPYYADWDALLLGDTLHVYGAEVVPSSTYDVQAISFVDTISSGCPLTLEGNYSDALSLVTAEWGDVVEPFAGGAAAQPDFSDIAALVSKFTGDPTAPAKSRAQLQPNVPDPSVPIDFTDIAECIDAFTGVEYPFAGPVACDDGAPPVLPPDCDGTIHEPPPSAPPAFVCQATTCVTQADCPGGCCYFDGPSATDKFCRDAAERCVVQ